MDAREAANSLILGICGQVERHRKGFNSRCAGKTVEDESGLLLAAMMTRRTGLLLTGRPANAEDCAALLADDLLAEGWTVPGVTRACGSRPRAVVARLAKALGKEYRLFQSLRLYELKQVRLSTPVEGRLRKAEAGDLRFLAGWWYDANLEMFGHADREAARETAEYRIAGRGRVPVGCRRAGFHGLQDPAAAHGISIGMVFTPPELRRRGYAHRLRSES